MSHKKQLHTQQGEAHRCGAGAGWLVLLAPVQALGASFGLPTAVGSSCPTAFPSGAFSQNTSVTAGSLTQHVCQLTNDQSLKIP